MPDGTPFDMPAHSPLPPPIEVPENCGEAASPGSCCRLRRQTPARSRTPQAESASRFVPATEMLIDSTSPLRIEEEIDIAHPRLAFELRRTAKPGYVGLAIARILEVRDRTIVFDEKFAPPVLTCAAHPVVDGWIDRVIGWIDNKVEELARYAADPTAGGGLQSADYFVLQLLNRHIPVLKHFRRSRYVHPERLYEEFLRIAGELATFATAERRARDLSGLRPRQPRRGLHAGRARHPGFPERPAWAGARSASRSSSGRPTPSSRRSATAACSATRRSCSRSPRAGPLTEIQSQFPHLFKVGPNTKMNEIVHAHLPGVNLIHLPTPPPQIRAITDHVYFYLDRTSPLWPEFQRASSHRHAFLRRLA